MGGNRGRLLGDGIYPKALHDLVLLKKKLFDPTVLLRHIYDGCYGSLDGPGIAAAVLIIAKYQYQSAFVADQEINMLACLTEIMVECKFK